MQRGENVLVWNERSIESREGTPKSLALLACVRFKGREVLGRAVEGLERDAGAFAFVRHSAPLIAARDNIFDHQYNRGAVMEGRARGRGGYTGVEYS